MRTSIPSHTRSHRTRHSRNGPDGRTRAAWWWSAAALTAALALAALVVLRQPSRGDAPGALPGGAAHRTARAPDPEPAVAAETPSSRLSGAVRTADGRPIARARVCAVSVDTEPVGSPPSPCTDTNEVGTFSLSDLGVDAYFVRAGAAGFAPGVANQGRPVALSAGETKSGLDIVLDVGGAKTSGVVVDATGGAVPHALVRVARAPGPGDVLDVETDDAGRFELFISQGAVAITAQAPGYSTAHAFATAPATGLTLVLIPGASISGIVTAASDGRPVADVTVRAVPAGSWGAPAHPSTVSSVDGTFTVGGLAPGEYSLLAEGRRLRGSLRGPLQVGVSDAVEGANIVVAPASVVVGRVVLRETGGPCTQGNVVLTQPERSATPVPTMMTNIGPDGAVQLESVVDGRYAIRVQCRDRVLAEGPRELSVAGNDVTGIVWKVAPGLGLDVRVVDQVDHPVPGSTLQLELPGAPGGPTPVMMLTTDGEGRYEYPMTLEPGHYVVAPSGNFRGRPVGVDLREGMGKVQVTLRLDGSGALLVDVRTPSGDRVEGVTVVAVRVSGGASTAAPTAAASPSAPDPTASAASAGPGREERAESATLLTRAQEGRAAASLGDGRFRVAPLEPGRYRVQVEDGVNPPALAGAGENPTLEIRDAAEVETTVVLDRGESIRGRVVDDAGGPLPNVWVSAIQDGEGDPNRRARTALALGGGPGPGQRVLTDLDGRFRLTNLRRDVEFALRAEHAHGGAAIQRHVRPGDSVTITFAATGTLRGVLVSADGIPLAGASLQVTHPETGYTRAAVTSQGGDWELAGVMSGHLRLYGSDESGHTAERDVDLAPKQTLDGLRLVVEAPASSPAATAPPPGLQSSN